MFVLGREKKLPPSSRPAADRSGAGMPAFSPTARCHVLPECAPHAGYAGTGDPL